MKTGRICWKTWKGTDIIHRRPSPPLSFYCKQKPQLHFIQQDVVHMFITDRAHALAGKKMQRLTL